MNLNQQIKDPRAISVRHFLKPFAEYLADPDVTEIAVPRQGTVFEKRYTGWHERQNSQITAEALSALFNSLSVYNGTSGPIQSVKLPDGERGQIVMPPAVIEGTVSLNIRKHSMIVKSLEDLIHEGAFSSYRNVSVNKPSEHETQEAHNKGLITASDVDLLRLLREGAIGEFLHQCIQTRQNLVIAGATGSGKTTFARSLIERVPLYDRLVTIEDVHELFLPHSNKVHLLYGAGTSGYITATDCLAACMRMTPGRIFLSELRGDETWDFLQSLNTGHPGSVTTTHSNNARNTFNRLALLIKQSQAGQQLDLSIIQQFLKSTINVVLYFSEFKLTEVWFDPIQARSQFL